MPRKKKETLVHFDIDTLSKQTERKDLPHTVSLGETLRSKREKKKLTLEDVARKLCIKEVYLRALEDGHYYAFPSRVYGIGFLRSYSKFLGLDSDLMVAEFHAETSDIKDAPLDMPVIEKHLALPSKKTLGIFALILLLLIIAWFTVSTLLTTDLFSKLPTPVLNTDIQETTSQQEEAPLVADEALTEAEPSEKEVQPQEEAKTEPVKQEEKQLDPRALTAKAAFIASREVWVSVYNTNTKKIILYTTMHKNDSFIPKSDLSVLEITVDRPGALSLYKNGEKVKTFGEEKSRSLAEFADAQD